MGIDLTAPFSTTIQSSHRVWPKCGRCSERLRRPYPVEVFGFVGREAPRELHGKFRLILEADCHGEHQTFALDIPDWYPDGKMMELVSKTILFGRENAQGRRFGVSFSDLRGMSWTGR